MIPVITPADLKKYLNSIGSKEFFSRSRMVRDGDRMSNYEIPMASLWADGCEIKLNIPMTAEIKDPKGEVRRCLLLRRKEPVSGVVQDTEFFDVHTAERIAPYKRLI